LALKWWQTTDIVERESELSLQKADRALDWLAEQGRLRREQAEREALETRRMNAQLATNFALARQRASAADEIDEANRKLQELGIQKLISISESSISQQIMSGRTYADEYVGVAEAETRQDRLDEIRKEAEHDAKLLYEKSGNRWADLLYADKQQRIDDVYNNYLTQRYPEEYGAPAEVIPEAPGVAQNLTTTITLAPEDVGMVHAGYDASGNWTENRPGLNITIAPDINTGEFIILGKENEPVGKVDAETGNLEFDDPLYPKLAMVMSQRDYEYLEETDYLVPPPSGFKALDIAYTRFMTEPKQIGGVTLPGPGYVLGMIGMVGAIVLTAWQAYPALSTMLRGGTPGRIFTNVYKKITIPKAQLPRVPASLTTVQEIRAFKAFQNYDQYKDLLKLAADKGWSPKSVAFQTMQARLFEAFQYEQAGNTIAAQRIIDQIRSATAISGAVPSARAVTPYTGTTTPTPQAPVAKPPITPPAQVGGALATQPAATPPTVSPAAGAAIATGAMQVPAMAGGVAVSGKEPWQMAKKEYVELPLTIRDKTSIGRSEIRARLREHKILVKEALSEGKPVPAEVLADYPDLAKVTPEAVKPTAPAMETTALAEGGTVTGEVPEVEVTVTGLEGVVSTESPKVEGFRAGWEQIIRKTEQAESGKWAARLVGQRSKTIYLQKEFTGKPTSNDFISLQNTLKKQTEVRYDQKTGKYLRVRKVVTHVTQVNWNALTPDERKPIVTGVGLEEGLASKSWGKLTLAEQKLLRTSGIVLPSLRVAGNNWNKLSATQREALLKVLGIDKVDTNKIWSALTKNEVKYLRDAVVGGKTQFTVDEAETALLVNLNQAIKSKDVVYKLVNLVKLAEPIRNITKGLKHEELVKRVGRAAAILESSEGREAFEKSKAALKGALPEADITPIEPGLTVDEVKELFEMIRQSDLRYFTKLNTNTALSKLLNGKIPTSGELELLERMFGKELGEALAALRSMGQKAWDTAMSILNLPRAILASFDLSAPLRQGALLFWGQPKQSLPAFKPMLQAFVSKDKAGMIDQIINSGKYAELRRDAGLYIAPLGEATPKIRQREEAFMTRYARYIPGISHSERAYVTYLNKVRADVFDSYASQWEGQGKTMEDYKKLADAINIMTGRGPLGKLTGIGDILNVGFFSPRYISSRIMLPYEFVRTTPLVRKMMAKNILAFIMANMAIFGLIYLGVKSSGEDISMETDPRSSDFGKIKIGNTRLDFWAGFQQYARFVSQLVVSMRKSTTTGEIIEAKRKDILDWFIRSKLSPAAGLAADILEGETFLGDEFSLEPDAVKQQAFQRLVPMFVQDMIEAIQDAGLAGGFMALPALLGVGVQTYGGVGQSAKDELSQALWKKGFNELTPEQQQQILDWLGV